MDRQPHSGFVSDFLALLLWCGVFALFAAGALKVTSAHWGREATWWLGIAELLFLAMVYCVRREALRCILLCAAFTLFATVSAYHLVTHAESCGCLGFISVAPQVMLSFDVLMASGACGAVVLSRKGNVGFFDGLGISVARCCCAGLLVASVTTVVLTQDAMRHATQTNASLLALDSRAHDISNAFAIDLTHGEWHVAVLKQSCSTCKKVLAAERTEKSPALIVMFVDDVFAFYAEKVPDDFELMVSPIHAKAGVDSAIVMPASMQMRDGKIIGFRSLVEA